IAADAGNPVDVAHLRLQYPGELRQHKVARRMAMRVVDEFKEIKVEHDQRERMPQAMRTILFFGEERIKRPTIPESRHDVLRRQQPELTQRVAQLQAVTD